MQLDAGGEIPHVLGGLSLPKIHGMDNKPRDFAAAVGNLVCWKTVFPKDIPYGETDVVANDATPSHNVTELHHQHKRAVGIIFVFTSLWLPLIFVSIVVISDLHVLLEEAMISLLPSEYYPNDDIWELLTCKVLHGSLLRLMD